MRDRLRWWWYDLQPWLFGVAVPFVVVVGLCWVVYRWA